jgi:broad specificity phosphatase PhoE
MKIILVRHGESEANVAGVINDDPARPVNLTQRGRAQATKVSNSLREMSFTHAYASQFPRAQQTAAIILGHHSCALSFDARINERRSGMDGLPVHSFNDLVRPDPLHIKPETGESFLELMHRMNDFLNEISIRHPTGIVLAVSHENPILAALALSSDQPDQVVLGSIANCECVELDFNQH